ncbi:MAG: hypothetical protein LEGION0398_MBIBDBAK_00042 [Legionellaceae bacterium]
MFKILSNWYRMYFSDPEAIFFVLILGSSIVIAMLLGNIFAPVFASIVIAYLLQWLVVSLQKYKVPRRIAIFITYISFISLVIFGILGILPALWRQLSSFLNDLPTNITRWQNLLVDLPEKYPTFISTEQLQHLMDEAKLELTRIGQVILSLSISSIPGFIMTCIYLVLVPLLVYFFLVDKDLIMNWCLSYLPQNRRLLKDVWKEVHEQIGNYIGGKVLEVLIVGIVCYITFALMGLHYAALLSTLVGLSVIIPYIGAVIVTIPIIIIAGVQWGWSAYFAYFIIAYTLIITVDANILVPLLFSEIVKLHPVAIIIAVLFFGGIWGFWGVFFAIPLASLVKAILRAWPKNKTLTMIDNNAN